MALRATVRNGRLIVDEPVELPDGTVLSLVIDDEGDDLDEADRKALNESLLQAWQQGESGLTAPAESLLQRLRSRRTL